MINPHLMANMELYRRGKLPPANKSMVEELYKRNNPELLDIAQRYGEPVLAMLSQAVLEPVSGLAGLGATIAEGPEAGADVVRRVQDLAYTPSAKGQESLEQLQQTLMETPIIGDYLQTAAEAPGDIGEMIYQKTGNPLFAALGEGTTAAALELGIPAKGARMATGAVEPNDIYSPKMFAGMTARNFPHGEVSDVLDQQRKNTAGDPYYQNRDLYNKTGVFRGLDDQLRFEIDDSPSTVNIEKIKQDTKNLRDDYAEAEGMAYDLEEVLDHPEFFENYPHLRNNYIEFSNKMPMGTRGVHYPSSGHIKLNESLLDDPATLKGVLLHELQHRVQKEEDFARGGSPRQANRIRYLIDEKAGQASQNRLSTEYLAEGTIRKLDENRELLNTASVLKDLEGLRRFSESPEPTRQARNIFNRGDWYRWSDEIRREFGAFPKRHRPKEERAQWLRNAAQFLASKRADDLDYDLAETIKNDPAQLQSQINRYTRRIDKLRQSPEFKELQEAKSIDEFMKGFSEDWNKTRDTMFGDEAVYEALAGEAEARLTQQRADMKMQDRKAQGLPIYRYPDREGRLMNETRLIPIIDDEFIVPQNIRR